MTELEKMILDAAQAYYTDGTSEYSDEEFDAMIDLLRTENPNSELFKTGWGYKVSEDTTPGEKVKHKYTRAGSLDKCRTWDELKSFQYKHVDISLKLDGISIVVYYKDGNLIQALTRGDGEIGIDVTDKVKRIIPEKLNSDDFTGALRGEILMSYANFEAYKQRHPEAKNPRNSTAGIINGKDTFDDLVYLEIGFYSIVGDENRIYSTIQGVRDKLVELVGEDGVVPYVTDQVLSSEDVCRTLFNQLRSCFYGRVPADGLVLTLNELPHVSSGCGVEYTAKAFKFPAESKACKVVDVIWNMTKSRYAMPKIQIEPVELSGTRVEFCTGYNAKYIMDNNIGEGSVLEIWKSGEIIPNVKRIITSTEPDVIEYCPDCGEPLIWSGVHLKCNNPACNNAVMQDTLHWMKQIAPVDGLGDVLIAKKLQLMVDEEWLPSASVESIMESDVILYDETAKAQDALFAKMWNMVHINDVSLWDALLALNIPRLGYVTAREFARYPDLVWRVVDMDEPDIIFADNVLGPKIGKANAHSIMDNLDKMRRLRYLTNRIVVLDLNVENKGRVAVTGSLSVKRSDFEAELIAAGYELGELSKDTKFLITNSPDSNSSKNKKAEAWGIVKVTEEDFRRNFL